MLLIAWPMGAYAETPPDAGQLLERSHEPLTVQPLEQPQIEAPAPAAVPQPAEEVFLLNRVHISGMTLFSEDTLHGLVADAEGKPQSLSDLQALAMRITRHYAGHGYFLARAYLPEQEIANGLVEVVVLEGKLEALKAEDSAGLPPRLLEKLNAGVAVGKPVQRQDVNRAVLLNNALPGIEASARLRPGDEAGGTVLVMETKQASIWAGDVTVDNHGDRYTGQQNARLRLEWNNPTGTGDQLGLRFQTTGENRLYGRLAYDFSVHGPLRANVSLSSSAYQLGKEFSGLDADGWARTATVDVRYPLIMQPTLRLNIQAGVDYMRLVDNTQATSTELDKDLADGRIGLSLQAADHWGGQSALSAQLTTGIVDINDPLEQAADNTTAGIAGGFSRINVSAERWQKLPVQFQLRAVASAQIALGNLTSAQKLPIGGVDAVRAYPPGEASGDDARLLTFELRRTVPLGTPWDPAAVIFTDYGYVKFNHETWAGFTGSNERELSAAGVGVDWKGPMGLSIAAWNAWPVKNEPITAEPDRNSRFWLSASWSF